MYRREGADGLEGLGRSPTAAGSAAAACHHSMAGPAAAPQLQPHLCRRHAAAGQAAQPGKEVDKSGWVDQGPGVALQLGIVQLALEGEMKWRAIKNV